MVFQGIRDDFLSNTVNKQMLLYILADHFSRAGCYVEHAKADADLLIVQNTIAATHKNPAINTVLVADDTYILILLCWHVKPTTPCIYFGPEPWQQTKRAPRCWNMSVVRTFLGPDVCKNIIFMHAILGCATTSALYGIEQVIGLKLVRNSTSFLEQALVFSTPSSTHAAVIAAGENALVLIYKLSLIHI